MPLTINTNIASLNAQRNLNMSQGSLATSMQRFHVDERDDVFPDIAPPAERVAARSTQRASVPAQRQKPLPQRKIHGRT